MSHGITMTAARRRVVAAIESGTVRTVRTGTRDGNIVRDLVNAGVLTAIRTYIPAEITYHGRRIPQAVVYSRIKVAR